MKTAMNFSPLIVSPSGAISSDSSGYCYSRSLTAAANVLTSITNGTGCNCCRCEMLAGAVCTAKSRSGKGV